MMNDPDDKLEDQEESEYHFSDEEESYEVEPETSKSTTGEETARQSFVSRLTGSKRMLISLVVFLVLVFVVYKMVAPTSTAPATDITAAPVAQQQPAKQPEQPPAQQPVQQAASGLPTAPGAAASPAVTTAPPVATLPSTTPQMPVSPIGALPGGTPPGQTAVTVSQPPAVTAPAAPTAAPTGNAPPPVSTPMAPLPPQTTTPLPPAQGAQTPPPPGLPPVVPVQTAQPPPPPLSPTVPAVSVQMPAATTTTVPASELDTKIAAVSTESQRLMGQLQGQYSQQFNDFTNQNKALQEQMRTLTARVQAMESQLNQLIQTLTTRNQGSTMVSPPPTAIIVPQAPEIKIAYNVQAIIPGRAWLKTDSGDTLTVAEGDMIKGVGRVTKIDPYDGVVVINTGTRTVSLSYGNGG